MISSMYNAIFYKPLYNGLVFLFSSTPAWFDMGMAIIVFTIIVKFILFPLSRASIKNQIKMKELEPKISEVKAKYKSNSQEQSMQIMKIYKDNHLNPLSGIFLVLIQIPILIALYHLFLSGGLPIIKPELLYSFVDLPSHVINMHFFGIDIVQKSIVLAFLAALTQYFQVKLSIPAIKTPADKNATGAEAFTNNLARTMNVQMRYILPIIVFVIAYSISAAIAIYWITSNLFAIGQELFVRRKLVDESNRLKESLIIK